LGGQVWAVEAGDFDDEMLLGEGPRATVLEVWVAPEVWLVPALWLAALLWLPLPL